MMKKDNIIIILLLLLDEDIIGVDAGGCIDLHRSCGVSGRRGRRNENGLPKLAVC